MANNLEFGIGLKIDKNSWKKEWEEMEKEIQKSIDESKFTIKIQGAEGLEAIKKQLQEIQAIQKQSSKPLTDYQAGKLNMLPRIAAAKETAKWEAKASETRENARKKAAQAEMAELKLAQAYDKTTRSIGRQTSAYKQQMGLMNGMKQFVNSYISILGAFRVVQNVKDITAEFERQRVALRAITQDAQFADQLFAKIKTTATESPFSTKDLVTYTKQLAAYRVENEELFGTMQMLADVSAGLGVSMDRLILAYGQVRAASVLRGCLGKGTRVNLYHGGARNVEDITKGDILIGDDGEERTVQEVIRGREQMYEVFASTGCVPSYRVNAHHILTLFDEKEDRVRDVYVSDYLEDPMRYYGVIYYDKGQMGTYDIYVRKDKVDDYYGFVIDGNKRFIIEDGIVTHNTELRQFTEAGIPLVDQLAEKFSQLRGEVVSTGEVFELISRRKVPFEMVAEIFKDMTEEGGRFYQIQKKQAESLYGVYENLADAVQNSFDDIGRSERGVLMGIGKGLTVLANNLQSISDALVPVIAGLSTYKLSLLLARKGTQSLATSNILLAKAEQKSTIAMAQQEAMLRRAAHMWVKAKAANDLYTKSLVKAATAHNVFVRSFYKLKAALIKNPITLTLTAIATVIGGAVTAFKRYTDGIASVDAANQKVQKSMDNMRASQERRYDTAALKELEEEIKEQDILIKSVGKDYQDLKKIYPELAAKYKDEQGWLEAVNGSYDKRKELLQRLKSDSSGFFSYLDTETAKVSDLKIGWDSLNEELRQYQIEQLKTQKASAENDLKGLEEKKKGFWYKYWDTEVVSSAIRKAFGIKGFLDSKIEGKNNEITALTENLKRLEEQEKDATQASLLFRDTYNKLMEGGRMDASELASLSFPESKSKTQKAYKEATENLKTYKDMLEALEQSDTSDESVRKQIINTRELIQDQEKMIANAKEYAKFGGFSLEEKGKTGGKSKTGDLKAQLSLVEQIYKRYQDLSKYMSESDAKSQITDIYKNLTDIDFLSPETYKTRLQKMAEEAEKLGDRNMAMKIRMKIQDVDLSEAKDKLKAAMEQISSQLSKQKNASEFFEKMIGLTGNTELSTQLTLAITGFNMEDATNVRDQMARGLAEALATAGQTIEIPSDISIGGEFNSANIQAAISEGRLSVQEMNRILEELKKAGKDSETVSLLEENLSAFVNYNKNLVAQVYDTIAEYSKADEKIRALQEQRNSAMNAEKPKEVDDADWEKYQDAIQRKYGEMIASIQFDEFQKKFAEQLGNMELASTKTLDSIQTELTNWLQSDEGAKASEGDIAAVYQIIERITKLKKERNPFEAWSASLKKLKLAREKGDAEEMEEAWLDFRNTVQVTSKAIGKTANAMSSVVDAALEVAEAFGITFSDETQEYIKNFQQGLKLLAPITTAFGMAILFTKYQVEGLETALFPLIIIVAALAAAFAAFKFFSEMKVRKANKIIEAQEKALIKLERAYKELERAQEDLSGSDWIENQKEQIDLLEDKIDRLTRQLEAEKYKGKKADEEAIKDYEDEIIDAEHEIADARKEVVKEMAGTDITSAAKDFAESWLEAYLSFSDTMGAVKEDFKDMMKSLVVNSLMAKLVQKRLEPVFKAIDNAFNNDNDLSVAEWENIQSIGQDAIEGLDRDLTNIAELYKLRDTLGGEGVSNLQGIAKGVAQASEDTVLTLSGYANSILYNQIIIKNDISVIRGILEGKIAAVNPKNPNEEGFNTGQLITLQQQSIVHLQAINDNTARTAESLERMEDKIDSVISTPGSTSRKRLNTSIS